MSPAVYRSLWWSNIPTVGLNGIRLGEVLVGGACPEFVTPQTSLRLLIAINFFQLCYGRD